MRRAYIIPGFRQPPRLFSGIARSFASRGFQPILLSPQWNHHVMTDYITEIEGQLATNTSRDVILGFSLGAYISLVLGSRHRFQKLFLCSTSPYFQEIIPIIPRAWTTLLGKRRMADFSQYRWRSIVKGVRSPAIVFCGENEGNIMLQFSSSLAKRLAPGGRMHGVEKTPHSIQNPKYQASLNQEISQLK